MPVDKTNTNLLSFAEMFQQVETICIQLSSQLQVEMADHAKEHCLEDLQRIAGHARLMVEPQIVELAVVVKLTGELQRKLDGLRCRKEKPNVG